MPEFETDVLGEPYTSETIPLPHDEEGPVHATLVRRRADFPTGRAVLHVHGFADYFFQTGYAEWWNERGYDFYALDLRKYGRSIAPHHTPNFVSDLRTYFEELDEAWQRVTGRDSHDHVVLSGHSTGGLVISLWAHDRRPALRGVVLNSPWFDLQGPPWMRTVGTHVIKQVGARRPRRVIPRKVSGLYARSLHRDHEGEWDFDLSWKPLESWPVYAGWLAAIRHGHAQLQAGIEVGAPALVLCSGRTSWPSEMGDDVHSSDIVLDVEQIRRWAPSVGRHVTIAAIEGGVHDVFLSREPARSQAYDELARFTSAYVDR